MKRILQSLISLLLFPMFIYAENSQGTTEVITLTKAGQLQLTLLDLETDYISSLTIKGPVNGKDIQYLRSGTGKLSKLEELNMADVSLVADEEPYCIITNPIEGTFQHEQYTYYISDKNYTEYLGVNSISMASTSLYNVYSNRLDGLFNQSNVGKTLKKVTLPHDFSSIGEYAFCGTSVESVIMGNPLKEVCNYAFNESKIKTVEADWSQLESVGSRAFAYSDFEGNKDNNTLDISRLDSIPYQAFIGCEIKKVILSPNLWFIGKGALCCSSLEEANVPSTLKYLWYDSFGYDSPFFNNLPTEDHVVYLGRFAMCAKEITSSISLRFKEGTEYIVDNFHIISNSSKCITDVVFPSTLKRIGEKAFSAYDMAVKSVTFPEGLEEIGYQAFYENVNLEKVTFPSTLKRIGESAFEGCGLTKVVIPENVIEIKRCAFQECKSLQRVEFNAHHVYDGGELNSKIFWKCPSLEKVTIGPEVEVIPTGMCRECKQLIMIEFLGREASAGKLQINDDAFYSCRLEEVVLPEGLDSIGENAFGNCSSLSSLTLPNSLERIGFNAFYSCTKLKELTIPKNVRNICYKSNNGTLGYGILEGCTALEKLTINCEESFVWTDQRLNSLKEVTFGSNTKTITDRAFYGLTTIEKINLSEGVESIGESAFYSCTGLTSLSLPMTLKSIGAGAFFGCESVTSPIILPMNLKSLGSSAFKNCTNLPAITLSEELEAIGDGTFCKCTAITEITIPQKVSVIGEEAFLGCTGLSTLSLSENLKSIGNYAFYGCTGLTEVGLKDNVETIGKYAFNGCTRLEVLSLGKKVASIGDYAFRDCSNLMSVYCYAIDIPSVGFCAFQNSNLDNATLYVPKGFKQKYLQAYGWKDFKKFEEFSISDKQSITITVRNYTRLYGEENPKFEFSTEGSELYGMPLITCEATKESSVGSYPIIITQGSVENSDVTYVNGTLTIEKAPLKITAKSYTIKQGDALPTFEADYDGFKNNETSEVLTKQPAFVTTATSSSAPGEYEITVSGAEAQNYDISYVAGKLTIVEADAVMITANSYTMKYGDELPKFEFSSVGADLEGSPAITCEATCQSPVGTYPIVITKGSVTNYNDTYVNGTLTIEKAPLKITAKSYTIKQGEDLPSFEATYEGFKNNETSAVLIKQPTITTTATSSSVPGEYEITVSGAEVQNYDISYVSGTLIIEAVVEIVPITETEEKSFSQQMNGTTNLSNTVIDNTYFNMNAANGDGYSSTEQALVLNSTTTSMQMHTVQDAQVGDAAVKDNFCGVIFEIPAGQGTITVDAKTIGTHVLNVQVGNGAPTKVTKSERGTVDVAYDVAAATYVYLYASTADGSAAPLHHAATVGANSVLLYGYKVTIGSGTGVNAVTIDKPVDVYTLQGQKVRSGATSLSGLTKGVYIINGRKVVVK